MGSKKLGDISHLCLKIQFNKLIFNLFFNRSFLCIFLHFGAASILYAWFIGLWKSFFEILHREINVGCLRFFGNKTGYKLE